MGDLLKSRAGSSVTFIAIFFYNHMQPEQKPQHRKKKQLAKPEYTNLTAFKAQ